MSKISHYFSTKEITRGLLIAILGSSFIYLNHWGFSHPLINTILGLLALYFLLDSSKKVWFFSGFFISLLWFWWIVLSFKHYEMLWAVPIGLLVISLTYGLMFWLISKLSHLLSSKVRCCSDLALLLLKSLGLLSLSYIHPFGFDWFKPELVFVESYIGIEKWQLAIVLLSMSLSLWKKKLFYLALVVFAYAYTPPTVSKPLENISLVSTQTTVKNKWNENLHTSQFQSILNTIDKAIDAKHTLVILPESVFPIFLNRSKELMHTLEQKAKHISIVVGGLYWDGKSPRNSTYIFTNNTVTIANKVLLVPFGESNPLPDFLSHWVNEVFYDGAVDYQASSDVVDYKINGEVYRNAICFEATSEKLYEGHPKNMIVLSNNGWFTPSIEPTLQKLLLRYYSKKYGTTIFHSANMSKSYIIQNGKQIKYEILKP